MTVNIEQFTRERWEDRRFVLGRVGPQSLRAPVEIDPTADSIETAVRQFASRDNFERLALLRALEFQGMDAQTAIGVLSPSSKVVSPSRQQRRETVVRDLLTSTPVVFGFLVTGRVLGYTPLAYERFCRERQAEPSLDELAAIAANPASLEQTAKFIAKMYGESQNKHWERAACLKDNDYKSFGEDWTSLAVKPARDNGEVPSLDFTGTVKFDARIRIARDDDASTTYGECPAADVFLPRLWQKMVADCVEMPELFPAEIEKMTASVGAR